MRWPSIALLVAGACGFVACSSDDPPPSRPFDEIPKFGGRIDGALAFTPDGRIGAAAAGEPKNRVRVSFTREAGRFVEVTADGLEDQYVSDLEFVPSGSHLVSVHGTWMPVHLRVWELPSGREIARGVLDLGLAMGGLAVSRDGRHLVAPAYGDRVQVFSLPDLRPIATMSGDGARMTGADISPDGRRVAAGDEDGTLRVWDLETGAEVARRSLTSSGEPPRLGAVRYGEGGVLGVFQLDGDDHFLILDADSLADRKRIRKEQGPFEFSPDGREVAIGGGDSLSLAMVFETGTGRELQVLGQPTGGGAVRILTIGLRGVWLQYIDGGDTLATKDSEGETRFYVREAD